MRAAGCPERGYAVIIPAFEFRPVRDSARIYARLLAHLARPLGRLFP